MTENHTKSTTPLVPVTTIVNAIACRKQVGTGGWNKGERPEFRMVAKITRAMFSDCSITPPQVERRIEEYARRYASGSPIFQPPVILEQRETSEQPEGSNDWGD